MSAKKKISEKCYVGEMASRQNDVGIFYISETSVGKMGEYGNKVHLLYQSQ